MLDIPINNNNFYKDRGIFYNEIIKLVQQNKINKVFLNSQ